MSDQEKTAEQLAAEQAAADQAAADAANEAAKKSKQKQVKARVLIDCSHGKVNTVVLVDAAVLKADNAEGGMRELDADKAAVAYAESLAS